MENHNGTKFVALFPISYNAFLLANNMNEVGDNMLNKWADDTINAMRFNKTPEELKEFFSIPDEYMDDLINKRYDIVQIVLKHDTDQKVLVLRLTLTITNGIIL